MRAARISPFVDLIRTNTQFGIGVAVDVQAFMVRPGVKKRYKGDPHFLAFAAVVYGILNHFLSPLDATLSLTCDEDAEKSYKCFQFLQAMKVRDKNVKDRVNSLCFTGSRLYIFLQAADLLARMYRQEAERVLLKCDSGFSVLWSHLLRKDLGRILNFRGIVFDAKALDILESDPTQEPVGTELSSIAP